MIFNIINTFYEITIHFLRDHNNLVIPKKRKEFQKKYLFYHPNYQNVIVTSKVIRRKQQRSIDRKSILKQSELEEAPNIQEATASNTIRVSSAILQDQVTLYMIYFTNLI
jgi:hypothetical protein